MVHSFAAIRTEGVGQVRDDERLWPVKQLLFEYVRGRSLSAIKQRRAWINWAQEIVKAIDGVDHYGGNGMRTGSACSSPPFHAASQLKICVTTSTPCPGSN